MKKTVKVGDILIGGGAPVSIQSMCNTKTADVAGSIEQIRRLEEAGCEIIRVAILDKEDALAVKRIKEQIHIPLVSDIHFNPDFAIQAILSGTDKIRLNPGNIEDEDKIREIVKLCKERSIPIRIGINAGSLNRKYTHSEEAMIESAKDHLRILEALDFHDICLSFKSSDPLECIKAYHLAAETFPYPLHLGVTEAGGLLNSTIKSSLALGNLLLDGIGDTIRISISDDPIEEVRVARKLLRACGLKKDVANLISCPTRGRLQYDMLPIVKEMEAYLETVDKDISVAIMGCPVNGPQEAARADIGVAGGKQSAILFKKGRIVRTIPQDQIIQTLKEEIEKL